jgi:hypothetical protein
MSSPPTESWKKEENDRDFKKVSVWIQSVDESKPLGKLVAHYARQKWWEGASCGFLVGLGVGVTLSAIFLRALRKLK